MAHLIEKDALEAKIDEFMFDANLEADIASTGECFDEKVADAKYRLCKQIRDYIDSLEVKEVDLDFLIHEEYAAAAKTEYDCIERAAFTKFEFTQLVKHIFELGLKTQKWK